MEHYNWLHPTDNNQNTTSAYCYCERCRNSRALLYPTSQNIYYPYEESYVPLNQQRVIIHDSREYKHFEQAGNREQVLWSYQQDVAYVQNPQPQEEVKKEENSEKNDEELGEEDDYEDDYDDEEEGEREEEENEDEDEEEEENELEDDLEDMEEEEDGEEEDGEEEEKGDEKVDSSPDESQSHEELKPKGLVEKSQKQKKDRTIFSQDQLEILEREFNEAMYVSRSRKQELSMELNLTEYQVKLAKNLKELVPKQTDENSPDKEAHEEFEQVWRSLHKGGHKI